MVSVSSVSLNGNPNQIYLSGEVASDSYQIEVYSKDKKILKILVKEGDTVHKGDPLYQYDATLDAINLELKKYQIESLKYEIEEYRKQYKQYAKKDYESLIPTPTPEATIFETSEPEKENQKGTSQSRKRVSDIFRISKYLNPLMSNITKAPSDYPIGTFPEYSSKDLVDAFYSGKEIVDSCTFYDGENEINYEIKLNFYKNSGDSMKQSGFEIGSSFTLIQGGQPNMLEGKGYILTNGTDFLVPAINSTFIKEYAVASYENKQNYVLELFGQTNGNPKLIISYTRLPGSTPEPQEEEEETITKEERLEKAEECATKIREAEIKQKQLMVDVQILEQQGVDGYIRSKMDGTVTSVGELDKLSDGQSLITVRGDEGFYVKCSVDEVNLEILKPGTKLDGFVYETGINCTGVVTSVDTVPTGDQNGSDSLTSSQYPVRIQIEDGEQIKAGQYIEFTLSGDNDETSGSLYIYEPYIKKADGESVVFIVRNEKLKQQTVQTGKVFFNYVEIINSDISTNDYIAFPYDKNAVNGATPIYAN